MPTAREAVEEQLRQDPFLQDAVDRGVINGSGLAEWLIDNRGLDHGKDALAKHIRDIQEEAADSKLEAARYALSEATIQTFSGRTVFSFSRADHVQQKLANLVGGLAIDEGDDIRLVTGKNAIVLLVVDEDGAKTAREEIGGLIDGTEEDLLEVRIEPGKTARGPELLGIALEAFEVYNLEVIHAHSGDPEQYVLLDVDDRLQVLRALGAAGP